MRTLGQFALTVSVVAALLGGCGGSQPLIGTPGAMAQNHTVVGPRVFAHRIRTTQSFYQVLYSFSGKPDGRNPEASLVDVKGVLYGTTIHGGKPRGSTSGPGTVFSITTTGAEQVLHSFDPFVSGKTPHANLVGVGGILYGTTFAGGKYGGGTIFNLTTTGTLHVLHSFGGSSNADGANPTAGLVNVSGTLYSTTLNGGTYDAGTVFSMTKDGAQQLLHSFGNGSDGKQATAALINVDGTLYGTTYSGGAYSGCSGGCGTVFSITTSGTEKLLYSFGSGNDGKWPQAGLVELNGKLYGTTFYGGPYDGGTVFRITPGGKEKVLYSFSYADGVHPYAGLINVGSTLYGTTVYGGSYDGGTVFRVTPTGKEEVLHAFGPQPDGASPNASLTDVNGTLYGTTEGGGSYGYGTVFALTP